MIVVHATVPVDAAQREDALDRVRELATKSRQEAGVIDYRATTDIQAPNTIRFFERYEDEAAFQAHAQSDHFMEFLTELPALLDGNPTVKRFDVDSVSDVEF